MTSQLGLIVTDASPLITLAAADALDCLTMPGLPVTIPDMVYFEVTRDLAQTGAQDIVAWARRHPSQIGIVPTNVFAEFQVLLTADPHIRSRSRGEFAALEVLNSAIASRADIEAILLFEDSDLTKRSFVRLLPERVMAISTGDLLLELEHAGKIQSRDHILDRAAQHERNVEAQRQPSANETARLALRTSLSDRNRR